MIKAAVCNDILFGTTALIHGWIRITGRALWYDGGLRFGRSSVTADKHLIMTSHIYPVNAARNAVQDRARVGATPLGYAAGLVAWHASTIVEELRHMQLAEGPSPELRPH